VQVSLGAAPGKAVVRRSIRFARVTYPKGVSSRALPGRWFFFRYCSFGGTTSAIRLDLLQKILTKLKLREFIKKILFNSFPKYL
jgi:hypothetical protein